MTLQDLLNTLFGRYVELKISEALSDREAIETNTDIFLCDLDKKTLNRIVWHIELVSSSRINVYIQ